MKFSQRSCETPSLADTRSMSSANVSAGLVAASPSRCAAAAPAWHVVRAREFIADREEHWDDDESADYFCGCPCGAEEFAGAVGFSSREDGQGVRWVFIGLRCLSCGLLGIYEDWKISYGPSLHLLDQV